MVQTPMKVSENTDNIDASSYIRTGLSTANTKFAVDNGGYVRCGKLVIVNLRLVATEAFSSATFTLVSGLPYSVLSSNCVAVCANKAGVNAFLNGNTLQATSREATSFTNGESLLISGVYIAS